MGHGVMYGDGACESTWERSPGRQGLESWDLSCTLQERQDLKKQKNKKQK